MGRVRRRHAGPRPGHHRRADLDHGTGRVHAGRRHRPSRSCLRPRVRQPARRRGGDRRRLGGAGQPRRRRRALLGAPGRRRQLRRRDVAGAGAPPRRPHRPRRGRVLRRRGRRRRGRRLARLRRRCARPAELAGQPHHRATGALPACRVALQEGRRHRRLLGRRSGGGCGRGQAPPHARHGGGRPDRAAAVRRAATAARRPVEPGVGELLHVCLHRETSRRRRRHLRRLPSQVRRPPGAGRAPHAPPRRCDGSCPLRRHPLHRSHIAVHRQLHRSHS